jgi:hypothetical protein
MNNSFEGMGKAAFALPMFSKICGPKRTAVLVMILLSVLEPCLSWSFCLRHRHHGELASSYFEKVIRGAYHRTLCR